LGTVFLFLDFDGVLHPVGTPALAEDFTLLDNPELFCFLSILEEILAPYSNVRIIVSSDWRRLFDDETLIRLLGGLGPRFEGIVECYNQVRATEISHEAQRRSLSYWIALDDHPSVVQAAILDKRFVPTNAKLGISDPVTQSVLQAVLTRITKDLCSPIE